MVIKGSKLRFLSDILKKELSLRNHHSGEKIQVQRDQFHRKFHQLMQLIKVSSVNGFSFQLRQEGTHARMRGPDSGLTRRPPNQAGNELTAQSRRGVIQRSQGSNSFFSRMVLNIKVLMLNICSIQLISLRILFLWQSTMTRFLNHNSPNETRVGEDNFFSPSL